MHPRRLGLFAGPHKMSCHRNPTNKRPGICRLPFDRSTSPWGLTLWGGFHKIAKQFDIKSFASSCWPCFREIPADRLNFFQLPDDSEAGVECLCAVRRFFCELIIAEFCNNER